MKKNYFLLFYLVTFFSFSQCPNSGDVIITEIMQNPSAVTDPNGEYFEVHNTTTSPIDMMGWVITDNGDDSFTVASSVIVAADGYAIFARNEDPMTNGGVTVDYEFSGMFLVNTDDEIILSCGGIEIDRVEYDGGPNFPNPTGASMELSITALNATDNNNGSNWGEASIVFGDGDFGSPGAPNDFTLSTNEFDLANSFKVYPNPTSTGEVTITSPDSTIMSIIVYDVLGKPVLTQTIKNDILDVSNLNSGIYILRITQNDISSTKKLIIR